MANYDSTNFEKEYEAAKQRVAAKNSFEEEYEAARLRVQGQKQTAPVSVVKQDIPQIQHQNYDRMQGLFNKSAQNELDDVNRQIQAISGYGVGADRSNLQSLLQKKDQLEAQLKTGRYDEDLSFADRLTLTAQGIGESYDAAAGVLVETAVGAIKGEKVDMNSDAIKAMQRANQAQQQATYGLGNAGQFAWTVAGSVIDNASRTPLVLVPGGKAVNRALTGARAAAQKMTEVGEKGGTARDAFLRGVGSGIVEAGTEGLGFDNAANILLKNTGDSVLKDILSQALAEGGEEALSYLGNLAIDKLAKDPDAEFSWKDLGMSVAAGAVAGGVLGGGASLVGSNVRSNNVTENAENVIKPAENVAENAVLQSTAKTEERAQLEKAVKEAAGIDTRTEVEKVTAKEREYVDNVQKLVESGIAPAEHLEQAQRKAAEAITEATNKQANLDYQKLDADSGRVRQEAMNSGKGKLIEDIEKFTNKRGFKVKYYSADADSVGNGFIDGDTIYINVQDSNVMAKTAIHETIHGLRSGNQQEYAKLYNSIMDYAEQYRALHDVADSVMAAYTNPESVAYNSVLDDDGNVDADKLGEEVLCKLCEEVIKDPESFIKNVDGSRTVLDAVADLLRKIKNSLAITLTKSESAKLDNAVMAIERYVRNEGGKSSKKYSVKLGGYADIQIDSRKSLGKYDLEKYNDAVYVQNKIFDTLMSEGFFDEDGKRFVENADTGIVIEINKSGIEETFGYGRNYAKLPRNMKELKIITIDKIPEIIKYGEVINSKPSYHNKHQGGATVDYTYIKHPVIIDGKEYRVEIDIRKSNVKNKFWVHRIYVNEKNNPSSLQSVVNNNHAAIGALGYSDSNISQVPKNDNGNNLSGNGGEKHSLAVDSSGADIAEDLKGKTIRERIEARANSGVTAKSQNVQTKAENALIRTISNAFGVRYTDKQGIIKEMVKEISAQVKATGAVNVEDIDRLVDTAFDKGVISSNEKAKMYPRLKAELREMRFKYQPSSIFQDMRNNYFGKLRFAKDGTDVDILYPILNEKYPDLFPEDITAPEDQIVRIGQVYDSLAENEQSLADYYGDSSEEMKNLIKEDLQYAVGMYIQELQGVERYEADKRITAGEKAVAKDRKPPTMAEYKAAQDEAHRAQKAVDKLLRDILLTDKEMRLIDTLLKGGDPDTVTGPNRDKILAVYSAKKAVKDARAPIKAYQFEVLRKRNDVADDVLTTFRSWKDKKLGLGYSTETFERNILDIVPDKAEAKRIIDTYITPIHAAEAQSNRLKKAMRDRVRELNIDSKANNSKAKLYVVEVFDKSKPYTLQADESGLVQLYGEKKITKEQLEKVGADVAKIEKAVEEFRKIYEELYEMANNSLLRNGYAPLGKIKDYFPHFTEENDTVLSKLAAKAGFEVQTNRLPTSIAGLTETFKPGRNWWSNLQHRTGDTTLFDAVTGFDQYIEGVANIINQTDNIQNLRSLENRLRYLASDEGVRTEMDRIDTLDISETEKYDLKQQLKDEVENSSLPNFVTYLRDYTNNLAGKKDFSDRQIEHDFGRGIYTVSKALEGRIASNMIGANIGSALTNFIPIAQAKAAIKTKYLVNAMNDTMRAFYGKDNGFENESDFLTNRFGSEKLVYTRAQRMSNMAGWLMNVCDRFTSNVVTRARYLQNIDSGMSSDEAMAEANSFAAGLIADRSKGAVPLVFERKNPIVKAVTMFQVEQNNQLRYLIKDLPKDLEKKGITALVSAIVQYAVASWLYNELYKIFVGRRPAFDPIDIGYGLVKDAQAVAKGEMKTSDALTNAATAVSKEIPFVSGLVGGGRIPISSALPDAAEVVKLLDSDVSADKKKAIAKKELTKPLWYLATPTAGGQIKKVAEAAELYGKNDGVQYSVQSDGSRKVQFAVDKTAGNVLQSALFGKWSSDEAQAYIDNGFKGLSKKQTEAFDGLKETGMSNKDAWAAADWKAADTDGNDSIKTAEATAYLDSKDFTREQKAILFSCMCPTVKKNPYK